MPPAARGLLYRSTMRNATAIGLMFLGVSTFPAVAGAIPSPPVTETEHGGRPEWYGSSILAIDLSALALVGGMAAAANGLSSTQGGGVRDSGTLAAAGGVVGLLAIGGYTFGGPSVHVWKGRWRRAVGSLVLRVFGPVLLMTAISMARCDDRGCEMSPMDFAIGTALASAIDAGLLAWG